jgi:hypothetical protein
MFNAEGRPAVQYLRNDLQAEEARIFFDQARARGQVDFEDEQENNFTLVYNRGGFYTIVFRGRHR